MRSTNIIRKLKTWKILIHKFTNLSGYFADGPSDGPDLVSDRYCIIWVVFHHHCDPVVFVGVVTILSSSRNS